MEILHHPRPGQGSLQPNLFAGHVTSESDPSDCSHSLCARLDAFFRARPGDWIDGRELAMVAGAYAWRSRVSELRRPPYNRTIQNRQRRYEHVTVSEYRLVTADANPSSPAPRVIE